MKKIFFIILLAGTGLSACKKMATVDLPVNQLTNARVFNDTTSLTAAVAGLFTQLGTVDANFVRNLGLYTDELKTTAVSASNTEFSNSSLSVTNSSVLSVWQNLYSTIYKANAIIEAMEAAPAIPLPARNTALGESKFIRAYCYFLLTRLYGDVPLIRSTNARANATRAKSNSNEVIAQVVSDFDAAAHLLQNNYPLNNGKTTANRFTALAYLSQACLTSERYARADSAASAVIGSGNYKLLTDLSKICTRNNEEALFQLWNQNGFSTLNLVAVSGIPANQLSASLFAAFTDADQRKSMWIGKTTVAGNTYYFPYKYRQRTANTGTAAEYTTYMRLAEVYLLRAEARAKMGDLNGAQTDMNTVRLRAGLPALTLSAKNDVLSAILQERRLELFNENGSRFFDLKRFGLLDATLRPAKPLWKPTAIVFPIPQTEILNDPNLTQNQGY